jgi:hypothetical protein
MLNRSVTLLIPRPPAAGCGDGLWFAPGCAGRQMSRSALAWRERVASAVDWHTRPQLIGNVEVVIQAWRPGGKMILTSHERQAVLDVLRCCRVVVDRQQVTHVRVEAFPALQVDELHVHACETIAAGRLLARGPEREEPITPLQSEQAERYQTAPAPDREVRS